MERMMVQVVLVFYLNWRVFKKIYLLILELISFYLTVKTAVNLSGRLMEKMTHTPGASALSFGRNKSHNAPCAMQFC